jgi:hypothetical protein
MTEKKRTDNSMTEEKRTAKIQNSVISRKIVHQPETISIYDPISDHYKVLGG